jgi:iron(III) transport system substrate-binding protein
MARWALPVAVLALAATAACGGAGGNGSANNSSLNSKSTADLYSAAKSEGKVTWYTTYVTQQAQQLGAAFTKKYPGVKVEILQGSVDKLTARLGVEQKARKFNDDVFQGDASYGTQLINAGNLVAYTPPDGPTLPAGIDLPKGFQNVDAVLTTVIAYNPTVLKQHGLTPPTSVQDLTKPQWKGQFSADDRNVNWYESLINSVGHDRAKALVQALAANRPTLVESHTLAVTQVQSGEPLATIAAYGYLASDLAKRTPNAMALVNPNPLPSAPDVVEIARNAPHPNAARLFLDWLVSREGQQAVVRTTNRISVVPGTGTDPAVWNPTTWKPAWSSPGLPADNFNTYTQELKTAFGAA